MGENRAIILVGEEAISSAQKYLLSLQHPSGYWSGELQADTTLESDTIKLDFFLGRQTPQRIKKLATYILSKQLPDGGWNIYYGGPSELNATVKAYFALRLAGHSAQMPSMKKTAETIRRLGGLERINSFEKIYLALFGQYPWSQVPALPPELILLPNWFAFNIYQTSAWTRTILVPLSVIYATRPKPACDTSVSLKELWATPQRKLTPAQSPQSLDGKLWRNFFLVNDLVLRSLEKIPYKPLRAHALKKAKTWMLERLVDSDGLGAIYPAMINAVIAFRGLGYQDGNPIFEEIVQQVHDLEIEEDDTIRVQPCFSPVWDTALAVFALASNNQAPSTEPAVPLMNAVNWLVSKEIRVAGDWKIKNSHPIPSGWFFEFRNAPYPDVDDTAMVLLALLAPFQKLESAPLPVQQATRRGVDWILSMQNDDGGWSSFDKNNHCTPLTFFPFADHNAMLDPSACDITGRVLELLGQLGYRTNHPSVSKAINFLTTHQESEECWFGRWGVNYLYGTCFVLRGLCSVGVDLSPPRFQRAAEWIRQHQNSDGGWGESCLSYEDPSTKGHGLSTASQTAWALMGLMAAGDRVSHSFQRGVSYLLETQLSDGSWEEEFFTGTGFPKVFHLKYHLYSVYFPLICLREIEKCHRSPVTSDPIRFTGDRCLVTSD